MHPTDPTPATAPSPHVILIGGHWLSASAWQQVISQLTDSGCRAIALTLPGLDPEDTHRLERTLADQVQAISALVRASAHPVVLVAHSGANAPVSQVIDQHPNRISRVIWVDSGPVAHGTVLGSEIPIGVTELPLPEFGELSQQASIAGLTDDALAGFRAHALPQPASVLREPVQLSNPARYEVATTFVCCSFPSTQVQQLVAERHPMFAEVSHYARVEYVDLPTGHWPMWSEPRALAELIAARA